LKYIQGDGDVISSYQPVSNYLYIGSSDVTAICGHYDIYTVSQKKRPTLDYYNFDT